MKVKLYDKNDWLCKEVESVSGIVTGAKDEVTRYVSGKLQDFDGNRNRLVITIEGIPNGGGAPKQEGDRHYPFGQGYVEVEDHRWKTT